ncbi:methyltransferase domain-containing protein [bacterium]|nr:methyltransferase domain-containing protein [bacterium]
MSDFWNERYKQANYIYGENPNEFLKEQLALLPAGSILFPADGEGRNSVYAATQGWQSIAFDASTEGRKKALQLAEKKQVVVDYQIDTLDDFDFGSARFDVVSFIFVHMPPELRTRVHRKAAEALKPGGKIILEAFSKKQMTKESGGPKNIEWLSSVEELQHDFDGLTIDLLHETDTVLDEGVYHAGKASVVRLVATKK